MKRTKKQTDINDLLNAVSIICYGKPKEHWIKFILDTEYPDDVKQETIARLKGDNTHE